MLRLEKDSDNPGADRVPKLGAGSTVGLDGRIAQ